MNSRFVRAHLKVGGMHLRRNRKYPHAAWLGAPRSDRFVRCYPKAEVGAFRVEHQANRAFLQKHGIETPADFPRLSEILIRQMGFYRVDWVRLGRSISRHPRYSETVLHKARQRKGNLTELLTFLRQVRVSNPTRFLRPLPINAVIYDALRRWAQNWIREGTVEE